ncbi:hypothetical protein D3875_12900 [Deinococcus cavernae]|uniref:Uncharacterized protein n=1 Tax=Deinococcus cavernae TaxID=2320857 RepID=A0A418V8A1_9DEIO|nr:hypothetical protein D3875_12900 [Deinococcus cavernae]
MPLHSHFSLQGLLIVTQRIKCGSALRAFTSPVQKNVAEPGMSFCYGNTAQQNAEQVLIRFLSGLKGFQGKSAEPNVSCLHLGGYFSFWLWVSLGFAQGQNCTSKAQKFSSLRGFQLLCPVKNVRESGVGTEVHIPLVVQSVPKVTRWSFIFHHFRDKFRKVFICSVTAE